MAGPQAGRDGTEDAAAAGDVSDDGISVEAESTTATIETTGATTAGVPFTGVAKVPVPRRCWYGAGWTGQRYYEYWKDGGVGRSSMTQDAYAAQGLLHEGFEQHATDTEGRWYEAECASHVPADEQVAYFLSHPAVYVMAGEPAPAVQESVDPRVLAQIAAEHMQLPVGTIRWNPSVKGSGATVVNLDTFVWVEDATTSVQVTASVPGVWSRVEARMASMALSAPNARDVTCPDAGTPYAAGMTGSSCAIVFERSSANQPVKSGQQYPTVTLTATARWEATWTSSLDPTPQALEVQTRTVTAEVPVGEVQTIVTR
ncbi:hypothetical protein [Cellulomonas sp. KH9]|uniref:hypothetical protein n=1 Tax=Cellulomonas sp. KH9 TaxID=1855324 RepID=UPI001160307A|nr:hypothetical protein [Cellulomonas sp. KH9]